MEIKDPQKLIRFIEAAISNPRHPVYQAGLFRAPALQHYATNVALLCAIKPEQWVKEDLNGYASQVNEARDLVGAEPKPAPEPAGDASPAADTVSKADFDALKAGLADLAQKFGAQASAAAVASPAAAPDEDDDENDDADSHPRTGTTS